MNNTIVVDDGLKKYDITNKEGKVLGCFTFNPSDTNIIHRHAEVVDDLEKLRKQELECETDGKLKEAIGEMEEIVFEKMNYLFNADVSNDFFSIMGPFSLLASGQFFIEVVLDAIGRVIQAEMKAYVKKKQEKIRKATAKYHKE